MKVFFKFIQIILVVFVFGAIFMCGFIRGFDLKQQAISKMNNRVGEIENILLEQNPPIDTTECVGCFKGTKTALKYETITNKQEKQIENR